MTGSLRAAILVGGQSQRMGAPKHRLPWGEHDLLHHVLEAARPVVDEVVLVGRDLAERGLPCWEDVPGVPGPLGGLLALTRRQPNTRWIVLSCDLPRMTSEAVGWIAAQERAGWFAMIPRTRSGHPQPLAALYGPGSGALLEAVALDGGAGPRALVDHPRVDSPLVPEHLEPCWTNVNTPEDLERCSRSTSDTVVP